MATWTFVKKTGAPAGVINITGVSGTFEIDDTTNTTIITSDPVVAANLTVHPFLTLQGVAGAYQQLISGTQAKILAWALSSAYVLTNATRDVNGAVTVATLTWPDGSVGTFTTDVASTAFPGTVDAYHVTYTVPGTNAVITLTQTTVTRDANGAVLSQPTPTFS
jgi:hypothetical protein